MLRGALTVGLRNRIARGVLRRCQSGSFGGGVGARQMEKLRKLSVRTLDAPPEAEPSCCICFCGFVAGDQLLTLRCGHEYHPECITTWLMAKRTCPMCKQCAADEADEDASPPALD